RSPAVPIHGRAFTALTRSPPPFEPVDRRVIGEQRPIELQAQQVDEGAAHRAHNREGLEFFGCRDRRCCGCGSGVDGRRAHDPYPLTLLRTWPTMKRNEHATHSTTVIILRGVSYSGFWAFFQKYQ